MHTSLETMRETSFHTNMQQKLYHKNHKLYDSALLCMHAPPAVCVGNARGGNINSMFQYFTLVHFKFVSAAAEELKMHTHICGRNTNMKHAAYGTFVEIVQLLKS